VKAIYEAAAFIEKHTRTGIDIGVVILTGSPAGVGPVHRGDNLHDFVEGVGEIAAKVV